MFCADLVREFGVETILIYNALLLKKKVVVYAASIESLLTVCRWVGLSVLHTMLYYSNYSTV